MISISGLVKRSYPGGKLASLPECTCVWCGAHSSISGPAWSVAMIAASLEGQLLTSRAFLATCAWQEKSDSCLEHCCPPRSICTSPASVMQTVASALCRLPCAPQVVFTQATSRWWYSHTGPLTNMRPTGGHPGRT